MEHIFYRKEPYKIRHKELDSALSNQESIDYVSEGDVLL